MGNTAEFPHLQKSINRIINTEKFCKECDVSISNVTKKGEGFLGEIYFVSVKDSQKTLNVVIKAALRNETVREKFVIKNIYENEIYFYSTVYPALKEFEAEVSPIHKFTAIPKCYGFSSEVGEETVCLENLKFDKFEILDQKELFDENYVKIVFDKYAHLHALSFAYKDKKIEEYDILVSKIDNIWNKMEFDVFITSMSDCVKDVREYFKQVGNDDIVEKLNKYVVNTHDIFFKPLNENSHYSAILHGDGRANNIMFKYEENKSNKIPLEIKFLDFQMCVCDTPARDLTYAFYTSASKKEFDRKDEFLKYYYEQFSMYVRELGSDPNKLFPYKNLMEDFDKFSKVGFLLALIISKSQLTDSGEAMDLNDLVKDNGTFLPGSYDKEEFLKRAKNLVIHLHETNIL